MGGPRGWWSSFRESILFMPTLMTVGALALFVATSLLDQRLRLGQAPPLEGPFSFLLFGGTGEAARHLLGAIAGTWATIVGVVYSVTLVTVQLSATKYSAQVIPTFERDTLNQVVLGAFTGTFVYALLVLKTVRTGDGAFVPVIGVNVSVVVAIASLFLLIAFIGNLTAYIRPTRFVDDLGSRAVLRLDAMRAPAGVRGFEPTRASPLAWRGASAYVLAEEDGHVVDVDWARLARTLDACEVAGRAARIDLLASVGERLVGGERVLAVRGVEKLPPHEESRLRKLVRIQAVADNEHPTEAAETLGDIGVTALSEGSLDVGVGKAATLALLRLGRASLEGERPASAFLVGAGRVLLVRPDAEAYAAALVALKRILDKAAAQGAWDVHELLCANVAPLVEAAARRDARAWDDVAAWLRPVAQQALAYRDHGAVSRMARQLRLVAERLRDAGHEERAIEVESLLLDAARAAGTEPRLRAELLAEPDE